MSDKIELPATIVVAYKQEKHPDRFITFLGAFTSQQAADEACEYDGSQVFSNDRPTTLNRHLFVYWTEELLLVK